MLKAVLRAEPQYADVRVTVEENPSPMSVLALVFRVFDVD